MAIYKIVKIQTVNYSNTKLILIKDKIQRQPKRIVKQMTQLV